jgi:predicted Rossmann fold nucleotide-binding protein DprA/Smf involved in DNA uptake
MERNRLIYAAADYAVVVASDAGSGGTWAGANEALRHGWLPVFVLEHPDMPEGNRQLLERGARPLPYPIRTRPQDLTDWFAEHSKAGENKPAQLGLF